MKAKGRAKLQLVQGGFGNIKPEPRCQVAVQAVMAGHQDFRVQAANAQNTGRGHGVVTLRVGRVLIYLEDRAALFSWQRAVERAVEVQDTAFGPEMPPMKIETY